MARRGSGDRDGIIRASLDGTALRMTDDHVDRDTAIAEIRKIATVDKTLQVDLLTEAAGGLLARHMHRPSGQRYRHAALLLWHAGADPEGAKEHAQIGLVALREGTRGGIGNPRG
ncbi:hypothetical protein GCM10007979_51810 [Nocardioides albus]|nr:hypothetical protein GCM10007979_51810 [Nocardioides albus]